MSHAVSYEDFGNLKQVKPTGSLYSVRLDVNDPKTEIALLEVDHNGELIHWQSYVSPKEFVTTAMKESLMIYVKRRVVALHPDKFSKDDPRLHSYISRLSYEGIQHVATRIEQFAEEFLSGKITMKIPQHRYNQRKK